MKILIVDNHDLIIDSLSRLIIENNISNNILSATNGAQALELAIAHNPKLIISDYKMGELNGLQLLIEVKKNNLLSKFMIISMVDEAAVIEQLVNNDINGYVNKDCNKAELLDGIQKVLNGEKFFCKNTQETLKKHKRSNKQDVFLSKREIETLRLISMDKKNQEIASVLNISVSTVETHKKNLIKKLGVNGAAGLIRYVAESKMFD